MVCRFPARLCIGLGLLAFLGPALAADATRTFAIPAGDAAVTLKLAAQQGGLEIAFFAETVRGFRTPALQGNFTPRDALDQLVAGTALTIDQRDNTFTIRRREPLPSIVPNPSSASPASPDPPHSMKSKNPLAILGAWLALAIAPSPSTLAADGIVIPTGAVEGRVFNAAAQRFVGNARIEVAGTKIQAFTDAYGGFELSGVPAGAVTLRVFYTGAKAREINVTVDAGHTVKQEIEIFGDASSTADAVVNLEKFVVAEARTMNAAALAINEQRFGNSIKSVVSTDAYGDYIDGTVGEFVKNMPGVAVDPDRGTVIVRGLPAGFTAVTLDGNRMAGANGADDTRAVSLDQTALNNLARLELVKSPTPDMGADSLGGTINLISKSAFEFARPTFNYRVMATMNSDYLTLDKTPYPDRNGSYKIKPSTDFSYIVPVNSRFGFTVNGMFNDQFIATRNMRSEYSPLSPGTATRPFFSKFEINDNTSEKTRTTFGISVNWRAAARDVLSFSATHNLAEGQSSTHYLLPQIGSPRDATTAAYDQGYAYGAVGKGKIEYGGSHSFNRSISDMLALTYRHRGPVWELEGGVSYARSTSHVGDLQKGMLETVLLTLPNVTIDYTDIHDRPYNIAIRDAAGNPVDLYTSAGKPFISIKSKQNRDVADYTKGAKFNARRKLGLAAPTALKAGVDVRQQIRDLNGPSYVYNFLGADKKANSGDETPELYGLLDPVRITPGWGLAAPEWVSSYKVYDLYRAHPDYFQFTDAAFYASNATENFRLNETISSAYAMADSRLLNNRLHLVGGVRFEQTDDKGEGRLVDPTRAYQRDASGKVVISAGKAVLLPEAADPIVLARLTNVVRGAHSTKTYDGYYPSFNGSFNITQDFVARASYARTLGRPDLNLILPNTSIQDTKFTIAANNTALQPWEANNFDLSLEYYFKSVGSFSLGMFRKDITNFFGLTSMAATPRLLEQYGLGPEYIDYTITQQSNIGNVRVTGLEVGYQHNLNALGGWARGVTVFANGTLLHLIGPELADFRGFTPKTANLGLGYSYKKLFGQLRWTYRGRQRVKTLGWTTSPDGFEYNAPRATVDLNGEYRFSKSVTLFFSGKNILKEGSDKEHFTAAMPAYSRIYLRTDAASQYAFGVKGQF